jgi:hypothetical protein
MSSRRIVEVVRAVQRGVRWLKGNSDSISDPRSLAVTIQALVAAERNPKSHAIQRLTAQLLERQAANGSWMDELWDTTWAVDALSVVGFRAQDVPLRNALRFFESTLDKPSGTWYEEPWETMLVLSSLARVSPSWSPFGADRAIEWIAGLQTSDGRIIGTRYTGMAISLFESILPEHDHRRQKLVPAGVGYLHRVLETQGVWTDAAWSNYYGLKGLIDSGVPLDHPNVEKAIDWFLRTQSEDGKWMQVSRVHDTAMAVLILSRFLSTPLVDLSPPRLGVLSIHRENGNLRVAYNPPGAGAVAPTEKIKVSESIREELTQNQHRLIAIAGSYRSASQQPAVSRGKLLPDVEGELLKLGRYAHGHGIPTRIQDALNQSSADHLRLDVDERLVDWPWELLHDGQEFLCLRYAMGRRIVSEHAPPPKPRRIKPNSETRALVVSDPTGNLPAAAEEGRRVTAVLRSRCRMDVDHFEAEQINKREFLVSLSNYDLVHFAGHANFNAEVPDESCLQFSDGEVNAFEIARFLGNKSPTVVFLNACWSAEESRNQQAFSPMMRGLGKTFMFAGVSAFVGYLLPIPDSSAVHFALQFYASLAEGQSIGESVRQARLAARAIRADDPTWSSAVLYGDPVIRVVQPVHEQI